MVDFEFDVEKLISHVEERPVLWDKTLEVYKDRNLTRDAWREICVEFIEDFHEKDPHEKKIIGQQIIKKWSNIRDAWMKACRKVEESKRFGSRKNTVRKYIYHNQLKFLQKVYKLGPDSSLGEAGNTFEEIILPETNIKFETESITDTVTTEDPVLVIPETSFSKRKHDNEAFSVGGIHNVAEVKEKKKKKINELDLRPMKTDQDSRKNSDDAHLSFFKGLLPSMKSLSNEQFIDFQLGVLKVLKNIRSQNSFSSIPPHAQSINFRESPFYNIVSSQMNPSIHYLPQPAHYQSEPFYQPPRPQLRQQKSQTVDPITSSSRLHSDLNAPQNSYNKNNLPQTTPASSPSLAESDMTCSQDADEDFL